MLKFRIAKLEDVDENLREMYKKGEDGAFYLAVEGAVAKEKLDEFRNNNVELMRRLDSLKDIDPKKYQDLLEQQRKIDEKKLIDAGQIDELVNQRVQEMQKENKKTVEQLNGQLQVANRQLESLIIDNSVREQAIKLGVAPSAVDDVLLRAKTVYHVEDGKAIPKDSEGKVIYGTDGQTPRPIGDWIGGLKETAPHLFQPSQGSGARHLRDGSGADQKNMSPTSKIAAGLRSGTSDAMV